MSISPCQPADLHISNVCVAALPSLGLQELNQLIAGCRRIRLGWDPNVEDDEAQLPKILSCWFDNGHEYVHVGEVLAGDDAALRGRIADYQLFFQGGGIGARVFPVTTYRGEPVLKQDGRPVFTVEMLNSEPYWIGGEPEFMVQAGKRMDFSKKHADGLKASAGVLSQTIDPTMLLRMNSDADR